MTDSARNLPVVEGDMSHLGLVLKHFGIPQKEIAAGIGVDSSMITKWKNGTSTLGVHSKSMKPLVDYILPPTRKLADADHRWFLARFAEAGLDHRYRNLGELRNTLTNYLANDGSIIGQADIARQRLYASDFFSIGGQNEILLFLEDEFSRCVEGQSILLSCAGCGIEIEPAFRDAIARASGEGARLKILLGWPAACQEGDLFTQLYLPELVSPRTLARNAATSCSPAIDAGVGTTILIPGRLCMHLTGRAGSAPYVASVIRQADYLREAEAGFTRALAEGSAVFMNARECTPRFISSRMSAFFRGGNDVLVASDGLNPLLMLPEAFERFLVRKGVDEAERAWRLNAFCAEQDALESKIARGGYYREMCTALDDARVLGEGAVLTNSLTFFDSQLVDLETTLDILQGYLRFATLYATFGVRFANPSRELRQGLWMVAPDGGCAGKGDDALDGREEGGLIVGFHDGGIRQLYSQDARMVRTVRELFEDAWGRIRYRLYADGRMLTSADEDGSTDPSRNVHFIRNRIEEVKQAIENRKR